LWDRHRPHVLGYGDMDVSPLCAISIPIEVLN
jgi:hypothetical protein